MRLQRENHAIQQKMMETERLHEQQQQEHKQQPQMQHADEQCE
jgi:hypothetical protein